MPTETLTAELILCRAPLAAAQVRQLARVDIAYFVSALAALATGVLRLFFYAKGVGFVRWSRALAQGGTPPAPDEVQAVRRLVHVELMLLALIPLMAVLMARGIGR